MESKTDSKEYQEAVEKIAKAIFEQRYPNGYFGLRWEELHLNRIDEMIRKCLNDAGELLSLKHPNSDVPLLVVTDPNQEPPQRHNMNSAIFEEGYDAALRDIRNHYKRVERP